MARPQILKRRRAPPGHAIPRTHQGRGFPVQYPASTGRTESGRDPRAHQPPAALRRTSGNLQPSRYRRATVTVAVADFVGSATLTALTFTTLPAGVTDGAL